MTELYNISALDSISWLMRLLYSHLCAFRYLPTALANLATKSAERLYFEAILWYPMNKIYDKHGDCHEIYRKGNQTEKRDGMPVEKSCARGCNIRAVALYMKFGFVVYGTRERAFRYKDGSYGSEYLMLLRL